MQRRCAEGGADPRDVGGVEPTGLCRCQGHLGHVRLALASQKGRTAAAVVARHWRPATHLRSQDPQADRLRLPLHWPARHHQAERVGHAVPVYDNKRRFERTVMFPAGTTVIPCWTTVRATWSRWKSTCGRRSRRANPSLKWARTSFCWRCCRITRTRLSKW